MAVAGANWPNSTAAIRAMNTSRVRCRESQLKIDGAEADGAEADGSEADGADEDLNIRLRYRNLRVFDLVFILVFIFILIVVPVVVVVAIVIG